MLTQTQYEAIANAMAHLNNAGFDVLTMALEHSSDGTSVTFAEMQPAVTIRRWKDGYEQREQFTGRSAFTRVYDERFSGSAA